MTSPFDRSLPSPLARLADLRYRASEAVVREGAATDVQLLMAPPGRLEEKLWDLLGQDDAPKLLVLTGSAGSGKSATINHLIRREEDSKAGRVGARLADATHSDSPDQEQGQRLAAFFSPFADDAVRPTEPCRLVALNTGMALSFFHDLPGMGGAPALTGLEALLRGRLGLPRKDGGQGPGWLDDAVLVINLDLRPTAGDTDDLFDEILERLDPDREDGVLEGTPRCATCSVRDGCWPMANARAISAPVGRAAVNGAAGRVALARGRQLAPRALWDAAAELVLSGLPCELPDPCDEIAAFRESGREEPLLQGLACNRALDTAGRASLVADICNFDPTYAAGAGAHALISDAGLAPEQDAALLVQHLGDHPAVIRAADRLRLGRLPDDGNRYWGRMLARGAWLGGELGGVEGLDENFTAALGAQADGRGLEDDAMLHALELIEEGLARVFGFVAGVEHYYPTASNAAGASADLLVKAQLLDDHLEPATDAALAANRSGAEAVGYRPLALALTVAGHAVTVDYPLWQLLQRATQGAPPSVIELERFLTLRTAMRQVGVVAAAANAPLLVRQRGQEGRKFRLVSRSASGDSLRATEVV